MANDVDISENDLLRSRPEVLQKLLLDHTTQKNIFWATDSYAHLGEGFGKEGYDRLSANEQMTLAYVWNGEEVSNAILQQLLSLNSIEAGRLLHNMVAKGLLTQNNKGRWTTYAIGLEMAKSEERNEESEERSEERGDKRKLPILTPIETQILKIMELDNKSTYESLGSKVAIGQTKVYKAIAHLKELGVIERTGGRANGCWKILLQEFVSEKGNCKQKQVHAIVYNSTDAKKK